jgi:PKD repeat protein
MKSFLIVLFLVWPSICLATVTKQINFEWEYDVTVKDLAGYILYQNGVLLHTVADPKALTVDLSVGLIPGSTEVFTMKAFDTNKNESALSAPYDLVVPSAVAGNNFLPEAAISYTQQELELMVTAVRSKDFDGRIVKYDWDFGDGSTASSADNPFKHIYNTYGNYTVTLRVTDNDGGVGITKLEISVGGLPVPQYFKATL